MSYYGRSGGGDSHHDRRGDDRRRDDRRRDDRGRGSSRDYDRDRDRNQGGSERGHYGGGGSDHYGGGGGGGGGAAPERDHYGGGGVGGHYGGGGGGDHYGGGRGSMRNHDDGRGSRDSHGGRRGDDRMGGGSQGRNYHEDGNNVGNMGGGNSGRGDDRRNSGRDNGDRAPYGHGDRHSGGGGDRNRDGQYGGGGGYGGDDRPYDRSSGDGGSSRGQSGGYGGDDRRYDRSSGDGGSSRGQSGGYGGDDRRYGHHGDGSDVAQRDRGGGSRGEYGRNDSRGRNGGDRYGAGGGGGGQQGHGYGEDRGHYGRNPGGDRGSGPGGGQGRGPRERGGIDRGGFGGGGSHGGRGGRGRGGGGGGGMKRGGGVASINVKEACANIIQASVTNNFRFYHYGIDITDKDGKTIESRGRRTHIFNFGFYDAEEGLYARNKMTKKEIEDFRRISFFEGSYCLTSRPIPHIKTFPFSVIGNKVPGSNSIEMPTGEMLTITNVQSFHAPESITGKALESSKDGIVVDLRCSGCTTAFKSKEAMFTHAKSTGHDPQMDFDEVETKPATIEVLSSFCNVALQRAMGERMARWGRDYIDPKNWTEPSDRNGRSMGVRIFRAFSCEFGIHRIDEQNCLALTVDLKAKIIRTKSLLDNLCHDRNPETVQFDRRDISEAKRKYQGEVVICTYDKKCYSVIDIDFDNSPASLPISGLGISHAEYFKERKGIELKYPNTKPIIVVLGRNDKKIYLPAELVCGNEMDPMIKQKLPMITSFTPSERHDAIEEIKKYLVPGGQRTKGVGGGFLPALGIVLQDNRLKVPVEVLPVPLLMAAGVNIPQSKGSNWAPVISRADYRVDKSQAVEMKVVVIHHNTLTNHVRTVYEKIRDLVNAHNSHYRFSDTPHDLISAGNDTEHCRAVEGYFGQSLPENIFVLDLVKPPRRQALDTAYNVVKYLLSRNGYLSQFLNYNTHDHANPRDQKAMRRSTTILQGLARQILSKCGARVWWVKIPREVPLPAVFVGVDVFHAPRKYSVILGKKVGKSSVAAVVVQIVRSHEESENTHTEIFSQTFQRDGMNEMQLGASINTTVSKALRIFDVNPMSCVMWRDGVGNPSIKQVVQEEIQPLRDALHRGNPNAKVPLSYLVVQKRISTKFISVDGSSALPPGALITSLQGPEYTTFYINGTSPNYSTPKPARFVIANKDDELKLTDRDIADLSWALCHDYSNWTGPIKLPSPVQMAHKLAELAGLMDGGGQEINSEKFAGRAHFL